MSDEVMYLLGHYARVQTMIEMLVQFRLRPLPDIRQGLGSAYFEQMSDATRKRWLKSLGSVHVNPSLGSRLESVYAEVADVRNQLAHSPSNISPSDANNPGDIRVGSARWIGKPIPAASDMLLALDRLQWVENWIVWLVSEQQSIQAYQKRDGVWMESKPNRPPSTPPS